MYESELAVVQELLPPGKAVEVGAGSGRFAARLGIAFGIEPSRRMRALARGRGIDAVDGTAEDLPYPDASFDVVLMVTTICFVDDLGASLREARRVLRPGGQIVVGFVDRDSPLGRDYAAHQAENPFYAVATLYSACELAGHLRRAGFTHLAFRQTIFTPLEEVTSTQPSMRGYGRGSFVVVRARKP